MSTRNSAYISANVNKPSARDRRSLLRNAGAGLVVATAGTVLGPAAEAAALDSSDSLALARQWVDMLNHRDIAGLTAIMADDFLYSTMARNPPEFVLRNSREKFLDQVRVSGAGSRFKKLVMMKVVGAFGTGNRAVLETEGYGELDDGYVYANVYCFTFWTENGKIKAIHEYVCTQTAWLLVQHMREKAKT
jgi:ketosteroid isomerase-like protein